VRNAELHGLYVVLPSCSDRRWIFFQSLNPIVRDIWQKEKAYKHSTKLNRSTLHNISHFHLTHSPLRSVLRNFDLFKYFLLSPLHVLADVLRFSESKSYSNFFSANCCKYERKSALMFLLPAESSEDITSSPTTEEFHSCFAKVIHSIQGRPGPTLASAGPDWKHFCGAPLSDAEIFDRQSRHNDRNR